MTNFQNINETLADMEQVISHAEAQLIESKRQEPTNEESFTQSQMMLEEVNMQLEKMIQSTQIEQRDRLIRLQQRVQQLQNRMILGI